MISYTVKKGDTLTAIANRYGTTVDKIKQANQDKIANVNDIKIGWLLNIPVNGKNYENIGRQLEKVIADIEKLPSYKTLRNLI